MSTCTAPRSRTATWSRSTASGSPAWPGRLSIWRVLWMRCKRCPSEMPHSATASVRTSSLNWWMSSGGRRGIAGARRSLALLDARSESPGESMSRVIFHQHRLPPPEPQLEVFAESGTFVGRSDFGWREQRTLGEFDGRSKYGRLLLRPGQTPEHALFQEKRREDALPDLGWEMVRWIWADLFAPAQLLDRLARAFVRGSRRVCGGTSAAASPHCGRYEWLRRQYRSQRRVAAATCRKGRNVRVSRGWAGWSGARLSGERVRGADLPLPVHARR
jgi:hypothetical protein